MSSDIYIFINIYILNKRKIYIFHYKKIIKNNEAIRLICLKFQKRLINIGKSRGVIIPRCISDLLNGNVQYCFEITEANHEQDHKKDLD